MLKTENSAIGFILLNVKFAERNGQIIAVMECWSTGSVQSNTASRHHSSNPSLQHSSNPPLQFKPTRQVAASWQQLQSRDRNVRRGVCCPVMLGNLPTPGP